MWGTFTGRVDRISSLPSLPPLRSNATMPSSLPGAGASCPGWSSNASVTSDASNPPPFEDYSDTYLAKLVKRAASRPPTSSRRSAAVPTAARSGKSCDRQEGLFSAPVRFAAFFGIISLVGHRWSAAQSAALHCRVTGARVEKIVA